LISGVISSPDLFLGYPSLVLGTLLLIVGFMFKFTIVPFHFWAADVFSGMPPFVAPIMVILPKLTLLSIYIRLLFLFLPSYESFPFMLDCFYTLSVIIGGISGLFELNLLRIVAFSGIVNVGLLLTPLHTGEIFAIHSSLLYFIIYFIVSFNLFSFIFAFRVKHSLLLESLNDLRFLYNSYPFIGILFAINLLSFAGIPPLAGFFPKFFTLCSLFEVGDFVVAFFVLFSSVISAFFYLEFIISIFFQYKNSFAPIERITMLSFSLILISSMLNIFFILYFPLLNNWILYYLLDIFDPWIL